MKTIKIGFKFSLANYKLPQVT